MTNTIQSLIYEIQENNYDREILLWIKEDLINALDLVNKELEC